MNELNKNWITEGLIDFEYKKYILLGYLKTVKSNFDEKKLYPFLSDLLFHYQNLLSIKDNKRLLHENFPKEISRADFEKLEIIYKKIIDDDKFMSEIEDIISFAIPRLKEHLINGKDIYEEIEEKMTISPIGISPLYPDEGYMLFYIDNRRETRVYEYQITIFENYNEKYRGIHTSYVESITKGVGLTFEAIKMDLVKRYKKLPNPATYLVDTNMKVPFDESLLPVAKRLLVKQIYKSAA